MLLQEPAAPGWPLQPQPGLPAAVQAVGTCVTSVAKTVSITDSVAWRPTCPLNPLNSVSRAKGGVETCFYTIVFVQITV